MLFRSPKTKAVVVVHLFGLAAQMDEIMAIARRHGIRVIEDAACAIGTTYDGKPIGSLGALGCFSFHPRKVVTTGEGGMVSTGDDLLATRVRSLRNHGATGVDPKEDPTKPIPWVPSICLATICVCRIYMPQLAWHRWQK